MPTAINSPGPIWICDPSGNNNPYLKITSNPLFVMVRSESYSGAAQVTNAGIWWSSDAINWTQATTPADSLPSLRLSANNTPLYYNGLWVVSFGFADGNFVLGNPEFADAIVYSYDGKTWNTGFIPTSAQINAGIIAMPAFLPGHGAPPNSILLDNSHIQNPPNVVTIDLPCRKPPSTDIKIINGDQLAEFGNVLVDPSQAGLTFGFNQSYAHNPLPSGITAVRIAHISGPVPDEVVHFDYTNTTITQTIVNSGADMPGATWITSFSQPALALACLAFYAFPS